MKRTLVTAILAGILVPTAMAEGDARPAREARPERPRPEGKPDKDGGKRMEKDGRDRRDLNPFGNPGEMFKRMDKDLDGNITKEEFLAAPHLQRLPEENREKFFNRLDRNQDGVISKDEIREMHKDAERRAKGQFRELDADKSGGLSFEEFSKGEFFAKLPEDKRRQIFGRMDTDGNGEINSQDHPKGPPRRKPEGSSPE